MKKFPVDLPNRTPVALADQVLINNSATNTTSYSTVQQVFDSGALLANKAVMALADKILISDSVGSVAKYSTVQQVFTSAGLLASLQIGANNHIDDAGLTYFNGGNVGVNVAVPTNKLHVAAGSFGSVQSLATILTDSGLRVADAGLAGQGGIYFGIGAGWQGVIQVTTTAPAVLPLSINPFGGNVGINIGNTTPTSPLQVVGLPIYANNAAAVGSGLTIGAFYRTGADPDHVCVVH